METRCKPAYFFISIILWGSFGLINYRSFAQSIPVNTPVLEEYLRRKLLNNTSDSILSFTIRPVKYAYLSENDTLFTSRNLGKHVQSKVLPIVFHQQVNTGKPYGWNNGPIVSSNGYQSVISGGIIIKYGPLEAQLNPEITFSNPSNLINSLGDSIYNRSTDYATIGFGQSNIRLNIGPVSFGVSTENLWWGPGRRSALIMSNNARGFKHLTLNTARPVFIGIGHLEGQIIAGKLEGSRSSPSIEKTNEWRYLSGMVVTYHPKWFKGLFIGVTRSFQMYHSELRTLGDYFPLFQAFEKANTQEDSVRRDQVTSVFFRLVLPESKMELYGEYGRNDHAFNLRDFAQQPQHSRAYLIGMQKLITMSKPGEQLLISAELTQMAQSISRVLRDAGAWYSHYQVLQGYSHFGEILGAGIGPGGSLQTLEVSRLKGLNKVGILLERYEHSRDYYQYKIDPENVLKSQWIDLSIGALVDWNYKNLLISGKVLGVQSMNYLWQSGLNGTQNKDPFNLHVNVGLAYYFRKKDERKKE